MSKKTETDDRASKTKLSRLFDAMADDSLQLSDAEVQREVGEQGEDPKKVAERMRASAQAMLTNIGKQRLAAAKERHAQSAKRQPSMFADWSIARLKSFVDRVLARQGGLSQLTLQHREGKSQSEADLRSLAEDLAALGLLDEEK